MGMTIGKKEVVKYREEEHKVPLVLYEIIVDKVGELPTNPIVDGEEIAQGSRCWVIESAVLYGYTSTGKWINQKDGGAAPVLIEKTISENGTYNASDDSADGYSSVTVDVSGEPHFNSVTTVMVDYGKSYATRIMLCRSENGEYILPNEEPNPDIYILIDPVVKVTAPAPGKIITFTPDENFDGFYSANGRKMSHTGDEATAGDGMTYQYATSMSGNTMIKTSNNFMFTIE